MSGATGGQMAGGLYFRNTSSRTCTLEGHPNVTLIGASGGMLPVEEVHGEAGPRFGPGMPRPFTWPVIIVRPRERAWSFVLSENWCGQDVARWRVTMPGGTFSDVTRGWTMGPCGDRSSGSILSVGGFAPPLQIPKWPLVPEIVDAPQRNARGGIDYVVTLMNVPERAFRFPASCPSYTQRIVQHRHVVATARFVLNCRPVGVVPGATAVRFEMRMDVPPAISGPATLVWVLDPPYGFPRSMPIRL